MNNLKQESKRYSGSTRLRTNLRVAILWAVLFFVVNQFVVNQCQVDLSPVMKTEQKMSDWTTTRNDNNGTALLEAWKEEAPGFATTLSAWHAKLPLPTTNRPFVFFHLRKGGGSSLRQIIHKASVEHKLASWIPCFTGRCIPFSIPPSRDRNAIYASHINYAHTTQLIRELQEKLPAATTQTIADQKGMPRSVTFVSLDTEETLRRSFGTCLANIRPTVDRVKSCWNYRMVQDTPKEWRLPLANTMAAEEWDILLPNAMDRYGNGCNNEIARIFGNTQDEKAVNRLSPQTDGIHFWNDLERVFSRMTKCVMVRVDRCEDSNIILKHYLPWMKADLCETKQNTGTITSKKQDLAKDVQEIILKHNQFDDLAFQFGTSLFEEQLKVATAAIANATTHLDKTGKKK